MILLVLGLLLVGCVFALCFGCEDIKRETIEPKVHGIMVTDFSNGESIKTETIDREITKKTLRTGVEK